MLEWLKDNLTAIFGRKAEDCNDKISKRQKLIFKIMLALILAVVLGLVILIQEKSETLAKKKIPEKQDIVKIELPDTAINTEKRWREHFEQLLAQQKSETNDRLKEMEEEQAKLVSRAGSEMQRELSDTKEKLKLAKNELINASLDLKRVAQDEEKRHLATPLHRESTMNILEFAKEVEYDMPKSAANYIPEGTYFTGHLSGGIVVSTALNAPDELSTPVSIQLKGRYDVRGRKISNLSPMNKLDLGKCRIMGSAYGDLSSERAIIRLEKLICERDGLYQTSRIAGQIFGPDGYNGIKGTVVSTSSKHIKNAMLGGLVSGLSSSSKGKEGMSLTGSGIITTQKKTMQDMLGRGAMQGVSNAGEKLADYYLRQAEAMSPVLTIAPGVRVNAQITKGFFVGEQSTHKKIKKAKK